MDLYYKTLIKLANKASKKKCVPVSAIVTKNKKIISKAYNTRNITNNVLDHAEIIAIKKATRKLNNWNLSNCEIYITMKPCNMCMAVINEAKIKKIHYILDNPNYNKMQEIVNNKKEFIKENDINDQYKNIIQNFFKKIREKC